MRNNIKRYRLMNGFTQAALGEKIGVKGNDIGRWELGKADPTPAQQQDVAMALNTRLTYVFPDFVPASSSSTKRIEISTMAGLKRSAGIKLGERMVVRVSSIDAEKNKNGTNVYIEGEVVEIQPCWFRIRTARGWSTCVHYQSFLSENDVRRVTK